MIEMVSPTEERKLSKEWRKEQESEAIAGFDSLLTTNQVAKILRVTENALQIWRHQGRGPRFVKFSSRCVRYRREDLERFINQGGVDNEE